MRLSHDNQYEWCNVSGKQQTCRLTRENTECRRERDHAAFNAWKYRDYFEFDSVKSDTNISVWSALCVGRKRLYTAKHPTSNLSKHISSRHRLISAPPAPPAMTPLPPSPGSAAERAERCVRPPAAVPRPCAGPRAGARLN